MSELRGTSAHVCPTCGSPVHVVSDDDGTSHYEPAGGAEMYALEQELRLQALAERDRLREALEQIARRRQNHPDQFVARRALGMPEGYDEMAGLHGRWKRDE